MPIQDRQLTYWHSDEGTTPQNARHPWTAVGAGSETVDTRSGVTITTATQLRYFKRNAFNSDQTGRRRATDRMDLQARFKGLSATTGGGWDAASAHCLVLDDGERCIGLAIGSVLQLIDPTNGTVLGNVSGSWPALERHNYRLVKSGTSFWEVYADGALVAGHAYAASAPSMFGVPTEAIGWFDVTGSGVGTWNELETGLNSILPDNAVVDRYRLNLPVLMQQQWNPRTRAVLRALVATTQIAIDKAQRLWFDHTAAQRSRLILINPGRERAAAFTGKHLPDAYEDWTLEGASAASFFSLVRERVRIATSTVTHWIQFDPATPVNNTEAVYYLAARFILRSDTSSNAQGRVGPFLTIKNGHRQVNAALFRSPYNRHEYFWILTSGGVTGAIVARGEVAMFVEPHEEVHVELYVIARDRVILFVNDRIVEDLPYSNFTTATGLTEYHIGRAGAADIGCVVDVWDGRCLTSFADEHYRPRFLQRVAERQLFAGGCERNDRLDAWLRHRHGVTQQRGPDIALTEVRRLACDDAAERIVDGEPGDWFIEVTYPEVTPIFLEAAGVISTVSYEFRALAPNFTPDELRTLLEYYILPRSVTEATFRALLTTNLTSNTVTAADTTFNVASVVGFEVGDAITLRKLQSGNALTLAYDVGKDRNDRYLRDFGALDQDAHGSANGVGATDSDLLNDANDNALWTAQSTSVYEGIETKASVTLNVAAGFCFSVKLTPGVAHDGNQYVIADMPNGIGTGGVFIEWTAGGLLQATIYDAVGTRVVSNAWDPGAGVENTVAVEYDPSGTNTIKLYVNGSSVASTDTTGFTPLNSGAGLFAVGARNSSNLDEFKGSLRDVWYFDYAIGAANIGFLHDDERTSAARKLLWAETAANRPRLCYMPNKHSAAVSRYEADPLQADVIDVASVANIVWGVWRIVAEGHLATEHGYYRQFAGSTAATGLDSHKVNNVTAGGTITIAGSAGSTGFAIVLGIRSGTAVRERVAIPDGSTTPGAQLWDEVHGVFLDRPSTATGEVRDTTSGNPLYQWGVGISAKGAYLLDPALRGAYKGGITADGATTDDLVILAHQSGGGEVLERITLNGTTEVETSNQLSAYHVLAMGYVPAARTITFEAHLVDPGGVFRAASSSASDTQTLYISYLDRSTGEAGVEALALNGVTKVSAAASMRSFLGATLDVAAVGTITLTMETGSATVTLGTIAAGEDAFAARRLALDMVGEIVQTYSAFSDPVPVGYWGLDEFGALVADVIWSEDITPDAGTVAWSRLMGIGLAQLPDDTWIELEGTVFREVGPRAASDVVRTLEAWTASTPVEGFDAVLDTDTGQDLTEFLTRNFTGSAGVTENTTISAIDAATKQITTPAISGSFLIGDRMRQGA